MKKIIFLLACVAGIVCSCTTQMGRANELIAEYSQKAEQANEELSEMATIELTQAQQDYILAYSKAYAYRTAVVVAKNWQLTTAWLEGEAMKYTAQAEMFRVELSPEQQAYASKHTEVMMYEATVAVLQKWQELHQ